MGKRTGGQSAPTTVNSSVRTREYLTTAEIERLMAAARKSSRYGHRDAWHDLIRYTAAETRTGRLHVRRAKNGSPSVHPMRGDEIRALRRLQREQRASSHVFQSERDGPMTPKAFHALFGRIGAIRDTSAHAAPRLRLCQWPTPATTHGRYRLGSATRTSSTRFDIPSFLPNGSGISGRIRTRH